MNTMYWMVVLGNVCDAVKALCPFSFVALLVLVLVYFFLVYEYCEDRAAKRVTCALKVAFFVLIVSSVLRVFVPSKKELFIVYGVGGVLDYIKQSPAAQRLPDKCIKAIDKWADALDEDNKNNEEQ